MKSRRKKHKPADEEELQLEVPWDLNREEIKRLLSARSKKYLAMGKNGFMGQAEAEEGIYNLAKVKTEKVYYTLRYDIMKNHKRQVKKVLRMSRVRVRSCSSALPNR